MNEARRGIWKGLNNAGDVTAIPALGSYGRLTDHISERTGGPYRLRRTDFAKGRVPEIANDSQFIRDFQEFRSQWDQLTPSQRLDLIAGIPGAMYNGLEDWFRDLYDKLGRAVTRRPLGSQ